MKNKPEEDSEDSEEDSDSDKDQSSFIILLCIKAYEWTTQTLPTLTQTSSNLPQVTT